jgi:hypothetical protein
MNIKFAVTFRYRLYKVKRSEESRELCVINSCLLNVAEFDTFTSAVFMEQKPWTANNLSANVEIAPF